MHDNFSYQINLFVFMKKEEENFFPYQGLEWKCMICTMLHPSKPVSPSKNETFRNLNKIFVLGQTLL